MDVKLVQFTEDAPDLAAISSGKADGGGIATNTWLTAMESKLPLSAVLVLDKSTTADAVLGNSKMTSVADLRGKSVAFEEGTTSDVLLHYALEQQKIPFSAIKPVHMPAAQAGTALIAGRVDAAVTYEPYISAALGAPKKIHPIFTAGQRPGLISDVLVLRTDVVRQHPEKIRALLKAWDDAVNYLRSDPQSGQAIITKAVGAPAGSLTSAFKGVEMFDRQQSQSLVKSTFPSTYLEIARAAKAGGLLKSDPPPFDRAFDGTFLSTAD